MLGNLKRGVKIGLRVLLRIKTRFVCNINSDAIKKGKSDGTINLPHNIIPFLAATNVLLEKKNKQIKKIKIEIANKFLLIVIIVYLIFIKSPT